MLIENADGYVYLGQRYSLKENNQDKEIQRRIMAGWAAYAKHRDNFKTTLPFSKSLKRQVYNSCVLPGCYEIMVIDLDTDQTRTEQTCGRSDQNGKKYVQHHIQQGQKDQHLGQGEAKSIDIISIVRKMKWSWAGHIKRLKDDRWTSRVTTWRPYDKKRQHGRPAIEAVYRRPGYAGARRSGRTQHKRG